ncbi:MAG: VOC family protein [Verrucomicrobia bacterium]|nr:VOC family protein [Verrucomicrobiota bacterium]
MNASFADKIAMQNRLFSELSRMFGKEVPLYDKSLLVNKECNKAVCALLGQMYSGFNLSDEQLNKTSGERHGAIRIGRPDEYRWIAGFFAAFGMEPHNYYNMTDVGSKSQPIVATAFRSRINPEHRVFCSLLMTDYFDPQTRERIEALLATRQVFSDRAKELVEKNASHGGLDSADAEELVREGTNRIFKWTGKARNFQLYEDLSKAGFKIAADIACFESHHLNHLTPNTFCMDLYTGAMKFCLGELDAATFRMRSIDALNQLLEFADLDYMKLHFKHMTADDIQGFTSRKISVEAISTLADELITKLQELGFDLGKLKHSGFKDFTEGPAGDTPILLRQDAYKALTEPVTFVQADGSKVETVHTARFGEIEQRFYATTPVGRELYDQCLAAAEVMKEKNPGLIKQDFSAYQKAYAECFAPFPKKLSELLAQKLVYGRYTVTQAGLAAAKEKKVDVTELCELVRRGYLRAEGLRYEDFLPISAAGIFASNLGQYGTKSTAAEKPVYRQEALEEVMGRKVIVSNLTYRGLQAGSILESYGDLGVIEQIPSEEQSQLREAAAACPA